MKRHIMDELWNLGKCMIAGTITLLYTAIVAIYGPHWTTWITATILNWIVVAGFVKAMITLGSNEWCMMVGILGALYSVVPILGTLLCIKLLCGS